MARRRRGPAGPDGCDHADLTADDAKTGVKRGGAKRSVPQNSGVGDMDMRAIGRLRARHLALARRRLAQADGVCEVLVNERESPLAWLAGHKGRDGQPRITPTQFLAGEKLRADFTLAQLAPRMTASWSAPAGGAARGGWDAAEASDVMIAARQRFNAALEAAGPEFSGVLTDVCCFLRGLAEVESERRWPARSGKLVLQLGLDRLARHYGLAARR